MYIKEVELKNFKSFGKRVLVPLKNDFTAITGPNGSGKSNIVDALLFALCLSSSRAMRAERLPDLIYRGDNGNNPDFAQVTVRLDNTSRAMAIEQDVIEISRKITTKNNKYFSSYYFNGKSCSQGELHDSLSRAGITPEGYNVVMQGDVTRIIEMTPVERRKIIDEIAGVAEFDEKKKKALEELEVVRERIGRVDVILEEVGAQMVKLKEERDRALSYQSYRDEKRRQEAFLLLAKLKEAEENLSELALESDQLRAEEAASSQKLEARSSDLKSLEERQKGLNAEIYHKGEDEQIAVKRRVEEIKGEIAIEESHIELSKKALDDADSQAKSGYIQMDKLRAEAESLASKIRDASIRLASLQGELEDRSLEAGQARSKIAEADAQFARARDELAAARHDREDCKAKLGDLVRERDRLLDSTRRGTSEREEIAAYIAESSEAMAAADREAAQIKSELADLNHKALEMEKDRDDLDGTRLRIKREIAEADRELQRLQSEYAKADGRLRAVEDRSGYSRAVEAIRSAIKRQLLKGLYGTIAELGDVTGAYASALEVAAGARLQSIVADNDEDAAMAIDYLKRSQIGRATFLPLNKLDRGDLPQTPSRPGVIDFALNLVDFDPRFHSAFWFVFRDTLVVESMDAARQLMGRYRMVTLDGDLVEKSGAMTGGHYKSRLKFAADEGKRLAEISERIASADSARSGLLEKMDRAEGEIARIGREVDELDKAIARKTFRLEEVGSVRPKLEKSIQEKRARLVEMEGEFVSIKDRLGKLESEIMETDALVRECQSRIDLLEKDLAGSNIPALNSQVDAAEAEIRRLQERIREIDSEVTRDRLRVESISEKQRELAARKEALEISKADSMKRQDESAQKILALRGELKSQKAREDLIEKELHGLKGERSEIADKMIEAQREMDRAQREMDRMEARLKANSSAEAEIRSVAVSLRSEIESCGVDCSQMPPKSEIVAQKIKGLEAAMRELEPVNMLAIDEYDKVLKRHSILQDRRETLSRERGEIIEKLERYDQMKKDAFMASFEEINSNFKSVFKELSNGDGELILEFPDDPLAGGMTIKARPQGKAFHRLEAMSGGEKSLTALSFIFSIQKHRPAPFYAMDEIDMFLDGVNVDRVARLIKKISAQAQFIVVSLRKPMIQQAKYTIGVTMQENNITSVTGICMS